MSASRRRVRRFRIRRSIEYPRQHRHARSRASNPAIRRLDHLALAATVQSEVPALAAFRAVLRGMNPSHALLCLAYLLTNYAAANGRTRANVLELVGRVYDVVVATGGAR